MTRNFRLALAAAALAILGTACDADRPAPTAPALQAPDIAALASAQTCSPNCTGTNLISTIFDADSAGALLYTRSDDYNGVGYATYASVNKVVSHIGANGGWDLQLFNQTGTSVRKVYLALHSIGTAFLDGLYYSGVQLYSQCFDASGTQISIQAMTAGSSNSKCGFATNFTSGQTTYKLAMGPNFDSPSATGRARVTCTAAASGSCTAWTILPDDTVANARVANLYHYDKNGNLVFDGVYRDSYRVNAAVQ